MRWMQRIAQISHGEREREESSDGGVGRYLCGIGTKDKNGLVGWCDGEESEYTKVKRREEIP